MYPTAAMADDAVVVGTHRRAGEHCGNAGMGRGVLIVHAEQRHAALGVERMKVRPECRRRTFPASGLTRPGERAAKARIVAQRHPWYQQEPRAPEEVGAVGDPDRPRRRRGRMAVRRRALRRPSGCATSGSGRDQASEHNYIVRRGRIRPAQTVLDVERQVVLLTRTKHHLPSADTW